jgi:hypothetical protein
MRLSPILLCVVLTACGGGEVRVVGDGVGSVRWDGHSCGTQCVPSPGASLTAEADAHSRFDGWSGGCSGRGACTFGRTVTFARFTATEFSLSVAPSDGGEVLVGGQVVPAIS